MRQFGWIAAMLLVLLMVAACGKSQHESESDWVTAIEVNMSQFQGAQAKGNEDIKKAKTVPQLKSAYQGYVALLDEVKSSLQKIKPPAQCEYAQEGVLDFLSEITGITKELAAGKIGTRLVALRKQEAAKRKFKLALGSLFTESHC